MLVKIATLKDSKKMAGAWRKYKNDNFDRDEIAAGNNDNRKNPNIIASRFVISASKSLKKIDVKSLECEARNNMKKELLKLSEMVNKTLEEFDG